MTLCVGRRQRITTSTILFENNMPDSDAAHGAAWNGATAYVVGNRVRREADGQMRMFTCISAHTNADPAIPENVGPTARWVTPGVTSQYRAFDDNAVSSSTLPDLNPLGVEYQWWRVLPFASDTNVVHIALLNIAGDRAVVAKLVSGGSANMLADSENFDAFTQTGLSLRTRGVLRDPFGLFNSWRLAEDTNNSEHRVADATTVTFVSGTSYSLTCWAKRGAGTRNFGLRFPSSRFGTAGGNFTLAGAGTAAAVGGATVTIADAGDGWYLCTATASATSSGTATGSFFSMLDASLNTTYTGTAGSLHLFGAQLVDRGMDPVIDFTTGYVVKIGLGFYIRTILRDYTLEYSGDGEFRTPDNPSFMVATGEIANTNFNTIYEVVVSKGPFNELPLVGEVLFVYDVRELGDLIPAVEDNLLDFSVKLRDDFGNTTLIPRNVADDINYTFKIDTADRAKIKNLLKSRRAQPLLFFDDTDPDNDKGIMQFGFINGYSMPLTSYSTQFVTLDTEGLT
jgi:hypothetical protein